jgi:tetratricopeptide (TPR) repeat protein
VQLIGRAGIDESSVANQRYLDEMNKITQGVGFISAARQTERSYEKDDFSHGVFTYALLEALSGNGDENQDGKVTFDEAVTYLDVRVPAMTNNRQHPFANTTAIEANNLALSVVTYGNLKSAGNSYGLLRVQVPDLDGVNVAIDDQQPAPLDKGIPRTFRVPAGSRRLVFSRGPTKREWNTRVEAGKIQPFTVNFAFSESQTADDSLVDPGEQINVYLPPENVPSRDAADTLKRGVDLFNRQDFKKAIEEFDKAIARESGQYAEALVYRGRAEQSLGLDKEAVQTFQKALGLRPTDYETQTLLAEARFNAIANLDQVERDLRDVINRHPDFAFARVVLADLLLYLNKPRQAEWELRQAINDDPNYPAAYLALADALTYQPSADKQKEAIAMAERGLALFKKVSEKKVKFSTGLKRLSISHVIFGHANYSDDRVMAEANHLIGKTKTRYVESSFRTLATSDRAAMLDTARASISEALRLAQKLADKRRLALALETSSQNYFLKGDMKSAIEEGNKALKIAAGFPDMKDFPDVHLTLSGAYESAQDYAKAAEHLEKYVAVETLGEDARNRKKEKIAFLWKRARANGQVK